MSPEEARKRLEERNKEQQVNSAIIAPNPSQFSFKWNSIKEQVDLPNNKKATMMSGAFSFQEKKEDGTWERLIVPQDKFGLAIIDHQIIQINGTDFDNNKRPVRSYWSNEMHQADSLTTPFMLKIKGRDKDSKPVTHIGTYKALKAEHKIAGRMHVIYGLTKKNQIVRLILPYYSYTKGSKDFKTHGDTFLDANANAGGRGVLDYWLTYDGYHTLTTGSSDYTSPIFKFTDKLNDEMIIALLEATERVDSWYKEYHANNLAYLEKLTSGTETKNEVYQGESKHGSENQAATAASVAATEEEPEMWDNDDLDSIPF